MDIAARLKRARESAGLSQNRLAKLSGVSQGIISSIEAGNRDPSLGVVARLSKALGLSLSAFFDDSYREVHSLLVTDDKEIDLLREMRLLTQSDQQVVRSVVRSISSKNFRKYTYKQGSSSKVHHMLNAANKDILPVHGTAAAGAPIFEERYEETIGVPAKYLDEDRYFVIQAKGNSMEPYIMNGDYVVVQRNATPENGEMALVMVDDCGMDEYTIKQFYRIGNTIELRSYNPEFSTLSYDVSVVKSAQIVVEVISALDE